MKIKCFAFMYSLLLTLAATAVTSSKSNDITWNKQAIFFINLGQFRQQFEDTNSVIYVESVVFDEVVEDIDLQNENSFTFCGGDYDPTYPGGSPAFFAYIQSSLKPLFALVTDSAFFQNPVYVAFKVNVEGCVEDVIIKRGGNELINEHIIMMMYSMPRWECGATDAKKYKTSYTFPITFLLN